MVIMIKSIVIFLKKNIVFLWLVLVPFIFTFYIVRSPQRYVQQNNDILSWAFTYNEFKANLYKYHNVAYWQNKSFLGFPTLGDPQSILTYPINYFSIVFDLPVFFTLYILFHLCLSSLSAFYLSNKILKLPKISSILVSFLYTFSPKIFSHIAEGHLNLVAAFSLIPVLLIAIHTFVKKPNFTKSVILGFFLSALYTSHISIFYYLLLVLIIVMIFCIFTKTFFLYKRTLIFIIFSALFTLLFQLPLVLAEIELWPKLSRNLLNFQDVAGPVYAWRQIISFIINPFTAAKNPVEYILYIGLTVLILAMIGFFTVKSNKIKVIIIISLLMLLLYSFGSKTPFYAMMFKFFPGVSLFRVPTRLFFLVSILISVLAGYGHKHINNRYSKVIANILIIFCFIEYLTIGNTILKSKEMSRDNMPQSIYLHLKNDTDSYFRVYCTSTCIQYNEIKDNNLGVAGGYNPVQLSNVFWFQQKMGGYKFGSYSPALPPYQTFGDQPQPDAQNLSLARVKYVISTYPLTDQSFVLISNTNNYYLYQNLKVLPRVYLNKENQAIPLNIIADKPGYIEVDVPENGEIIATEVYTPGWKAYFNNKKISLQEYKDIILSVMSPGKGRLLFKYEPLGTPLSWTVPMLSYTILIASIIKRFFTTK